MLLKNKYFKKLLLRFMNCSFKYFNKKFLKKDYKEISKKSAGNYAKIMVLYFLKKFFFLYDDNCSKFLINILNYFLLIYYLTNDNRHDNCFKKIYLFYNKLLQNINNNKYFIY